VMAAVAPAEHVHAVGADIGKRGRFGEVVAHPGIGDGNAGKEKPRRSGARVTGREDPLLHLTSTAAALIKGAEIHGSYA
jgi:hypothetical protein